MDRGSYLVTGGSRSGKSAYALYLAQDAVRPFYIATGWAGDSEMDERIARHQAERGEHWSTIETRLDVAGAIGDAVEQQADFIVLDCLTMWVSNMLFDEDETSIDQRVRQLIDSIVNLSVKIVIVTNEVGSGIVPADKLSRTFRDHAGWINQRIAATVDNVILTVSGIPLQIKPQ